MLPQEYISLIETLVKITNEGSLQWAKTGIDYQFYSNPTPEIKLLIDKYYSIWDGKQGACINLTTFENEEIADEIVCCDLEELESYNILNSLYNIVDKRIEDIESKKVIPLINRITGILQSKSVSK